jgi:hypothetical protein
MGRGSGDEATNLPASSVESESLTQLKGKAARLSIIDPNLSTSIFSLIETAEAAMALRDTLLKGSPGWLETPAGLRLLDALKELSDI